MENTIDGRSAFALETTLVTGPIGSGKTQRLIEQAAQLAFAHDARDVLVLCATPFTAREFKARFENFAGKDVARRVRTTTPRAFAMDVLSTDAAKAATGREPRMLTSTEETFLMEDMKVSGLRPRRLREMLKFFYRSFTELADDEQGAWLETAEEEQVHSLLKANLAFVRGYLECEVTATAYRLLRDDAQLRARLAVAHVLVDDYQLLSRASQKLARLTASRSLAVAGDELACTECYESYPYAEGIAEFAEEFPHAGRVDLSDCRHLKVIEEMSADAPADEMQSVARIVADAIEKGVDPADIIVAVPNAIWARNAYAALASAEIDCENPFARKRIARGDVRSKERCTNARILSLLDLAADPSNAAAWRSWCGYGDYLVRSGAFSALRTFAEKRRLALPEALRYAESERASRKQSLEGQIEDEFGAHTPGMESVLQAYRTAQAKIAEWRQPSAPLAGKALLDDIARFATDGKLSQAPIEVTKACLAEPNEGEGASAGKGEGVTDNPNSAQAMAQRARESLNEPRCESDHAVLVVPYDSVAGLSPRMLVVSGFVNGFIPNRDYFDATVTTIEKQEKMHARDARRVHVLASAPRERLVVSYFTSIDLENAEALKLKISRIRLKDGHRVCTISPSDFLQTIKPAL